MLQVLIVHRVDNGTCFIEAEKELKMHKTHQEVGPEDYDVIGASFPLPLHFKVACILAH